MARVDKKRPNKKRGKKHSNADKEKGADTQVEHNSEMANPVDPASSGPVIDQHFSAAHYGELNEEMLGYFKNVESNLDDPPFEEAEDQRLFVDNVYSEVDGNELRLATNYSCSLILEKLLKISNPIQLRVFTDKISGKAVELFVHRFASHVCQTLLTLAADVVEQEVLEGGAIKPESNGGEDMGELLSMEKLVLEMCEDIKPVVNGLMSQQFASHVIRTLLFVLAGKRIDEAGDTKGQLRSKRSVKYKMDNDNMAKTSSKASSVRQVPKSFKDMFRALTRELAINSSESDIRELSVHRVASPVLQLLLEMQDDDKEGNKVKTVLLDRILWGIVSDESAQSKDRDAWFETLIRDQVGSHLLEVVCKVAPDKVYNKIYETYLRKKLEKFSLQPVSNFVIQNLLSNARTEQQLDLMVKELSGSFEKLIQNGKHGVIRHLFDGVVRLQTSEKEAITALASALHMPTQEDQKEFVNCAMRMWTLDDWKNSTEEDQRSPRYFHIQGSLIIQAIAKMSPEHNAIVINSFLSQPPDVVHKWCYTPVGSRAFESILISPNVNGKMKKKILRNLEGSYVKLAMDKFGSHIVDHCWSVADIASKERIAAELVKRERELSEHYIGKCILWTCKIDQYKRRHDEWVEREKGVERKKDMFKDILGDDTLMPNKRPRHARTH